MDQPAGTGFSYTSTDRYVHTTDIVGSSTLRNPVIRLNLLLQAQQQLMEFLLNFYDVFPEYKTMDVRIFLLVVYFLLNTSIHLSRLTLQEKVLQANGYPIMVSNNPSSFAPLNLSFVHSGCHPKFNSEYTSPWNRHWKRLD